MKKIISCILMICLCSLALNIQPANAQLSSMTCTEIWTEGVCQAGQIWVPCESACVDQAAFSWIGDYCSNKPAIVCSMVVSATDPYVWYYVTPPAPYIPPEPPPLYPAWVSWFGVAWLIFAITLPLAREQGAQCAACMQGGDPSVCGYVCGSAYTFPLQ